MQIVNPELSAVTDTTMTVAFASLADDDSVDSSDVDVAIDPLHRGRRRVVKTSGDAVDARSGVRLATISELDPKTRYRVDILGGTEPVERHPIFFPDEFETLGTPAGEKLATVATISDLHFGEEVCGRGPGEGPTYSAATEDPPYWHYMNYAIIDEINSAQPDRVIVKGDLTSASEPGEFQLAHAALERLASPWDAFLGNHDMMNPSVDGYRLLDQAPLSVRSIEVEGCRLVMIDTVDPGEAAGRLTPERLVDLEAELDRETDTPTLVFGHHYTSDPAKPDTETFGIDRSDSAQFLDVLGRHPQVGGFFAGHTHRNRLRRFAPTGPLPHVEVCATKEYPGGWALYHIHEGGYMQELRRCRAPDALAWGDKTKEMYGGWYRVYALGKLTHRCFTYGWNARRGGPR